jgi:hypothetical protein
MLSNSKEEYDKNDVLVTDISPFRDFIIAHIKAGI